MVVHRAHTRKCLFNQLDHVVLKEVIDLENVLVVEFAPLLSGNILEKK